MRTGATRWLRGLTGLLFSVSLWTSPAAAAPPPEGPAEPAGPEDPEDSEDPEDLGAPQPDDDGPPAQVAAPFNLRPSDFNASALPMDRVVTWLDVATSRGNGTRRASTALSLLQFGKALVMDYRAFKAKASDRWDLQPDEDLKNRWTIDYILLDDPGKERQIEEHAAQLRALLAQRSDEKAADQGRQKKI